MSRTDFEKWGAESERTVVAVKSALLFLGSIDTIRLASRGLDMEAQALSNARLRLDELLRGNKPVVCHRCGGSGNDPEHEGSCGDCGGGNNA